MKIRKFIANKLTKLAMLIYPIEMQLKDLEEQTKRWESMDTMMKTILKGSLPNIEDLLKKNKPKIVN